MCDYRSYRKCEPQEGPPRSAIELLKEAERRKKEREEKKKE
jgi:hypothetical protein